MINPIDARRYVDTQDMLNECLSRTLRVTNSLEAVETMKYLSKALERAHPEAVDTLIGYINYLHKNFRRKK